MTIVRLVFLLAGTSCILGVTPGVRAQREQQSPEQSSTSSSNNPRYLCIAISGAVNTPTRMELHRRVRLSEAIVAADGLAVSAGKTVQIVHGADHSGCHERVLKMQNWQELQSTVLNLDDVFRGGEGSNPDLQDGDVVFVSTAALVYVVGNVAKPQSLVLKPAMTLTQAIALAGGVRRDNRMKVIRLIRQALQSSTKTEITVDLRAIGKRHAEDLELQPNDIIDVPMKHGHPGRVPFGIISQQLSLRVIS